jgi:hypothetical protein
MLFFNRSSIGWRVCQNPSTKSHFCWLPPRNILELYSTRVPTITTTWLMLCQARQCVIVTGKRWLIATEVTHSNEECVWVCLLKEADPICFRCARKQRTPPCLSSSRCVLVSDRVRVMWRELFGVWAKAKDADDPERICISYGQWASGSSPGPLRHLKPPIWAMSLGSSYHTTPVDIWRSLDPQILMFSFYGLKYWGNNKRTKRVIVWVFGLLLATINVSLKSIRWRH